MATKRKQKRQARRAAGKTRRAVKREARGGKTRIGAMLKKTGEAVKKGGQAAVLAPLLPFKGAMRTALKLRNEPVPKKMSDLIKAFFEKVVKPKGNFENLEDFDPVTLGAVVTAVVNFFKKMKAKKANNEAMSKEEEGFADTVEEVAKQASAMIEAGKDSEDDSEDDSEEESKSEKGSFIDGLIPTKKDGKKDYTLLIVGAALLFFYFKSKK